MRPRSWLLLIPVVVCSIYFAMAPVARAGAQAPLKSPSSDSGPFAEQAVLIDLNSSAVAADEIEFDSWDMHAVLNCCHSAGDLCSAKYTLLACVPCARGGAPSLVNQGVRLQI